MAEQRSLEFFHSPLHFPSSPFESNALESFEGTLSRKRKIISDISLPSSRKRFHEDFSIADELPLDDRPHYQQQQHRRSSGGQNLLFPEPAEASIHLTIDDSSPYDVVSVQREADLLSQLSSFLQNNEIPQPNQQYLHTPTEQFTPSPTPFPFSNNFTYFPEPSVEHNITYQEVCNVISNIQLDSHKFIPKQELLQQTKKLGIIYPNPLALYLSAPTQPLPLSGTYF